MYSKEKVEIVNDLILVSIYLSVLSCLSRTDFNIAFSLASYYLWDVRRDIVNTLLLLILNAVTIVFDFIWILSVSYIWTK